MAFNRHLAHLIISLQSSHGGVEGFRFMGHISWASINIYTGVYFGPPAYIFVVLKQKTMFKLTQKYPKE